MSALAYLIVRSFANSIRFRIARLRQPRYLVPVLAVAAYLWLASGMRGLASAASANPWSPNQATGAYVQVMTLALVAGGWLISSDRPAPVFTEAEVLALFQAPLSRRSLIVYSFLRSQPALMIVAGAMALLWPRHSPAGVAAQVLGVLALVNLLRLNNLLAALATASLLARGVRSFVSRLPGVIVAAYVVVSVGLSARSSPWLSRDLPGFLQWMSSWQHAPPASYLLWPWRVVAELPFSRDPSSLARNAAVAAAVLGAHLALALLLNPPFEEAALSQAQNLTRRLDAFRRGRGAAAHLATLKSAPSTPLRLAPSGPPWRAIAWKDLVGFLRGFSVRQALVVVVVVAMPALGALLSDTDDPRLVLAAGGWGLAMLLMIGPGAYGQGIRADLQLIEVVKTIPVPARQVLRGGIFGATLVSSLLGWFVLAAMTLMLCRLPSVPLSGLDLVSLCLAAMMMFSTVCAQIAAVESSLAVLAPAWVLPDKGQVGLENLGRELVIMVGRFLGLSVLLLPLAALCVPLALVVLVPAGLAWSAPLAVGAAGLGLLEVEGLCAWMGRKLDTLDPSRENLV